MDDIVKRAERLAALEERAKSGILMLDGAMGTEIQKHKLTEADYRGERFADWQSPVAGNNDLLNLTQPNIIKGIHTAYFEAGSGSVRPKRIGLERSGLNLSQATS